MSQVRKSAHPEFGLEGGRIVRHCEAGQLTFA